MMKHPKIGDTVHYVAFGTEGGPYPKGVHHAAIVTGVGRAADEVNLCVFYENGTSFKLGIRYSESPKPGTWHSPDDDVYERKL